MRSIALISLCAAGILAAPQGSAENDVLVAMNAYKDARLHGDSVVLQTLLSDGLVYVGADGAVMNKAEMLKSAAHGPNPVKIEYLDDTTVRMNGNVAVVTGREDVWDARVVTHLHVMHVWEKTRRGWQLITRQATLISTQTRTI